MEESIVFSFFMIFAGAAALASLALYTKQPLLIAYIVLGGLLGPYGMSYVEDTKLLEDISHVGIIFLLFLLGLDMQPDHLVHTFKKSSTVALISSIYLAMIGYVTASAFGYTMTESIIIGVSIIFSSTIIGIKLLPTTVLHHKATGELMIGLLLLQDVFAIITLLVLNQMGSEASDANWVDYLKPILAFPILIGGAFFLVKYVILRLMAKFDKVQEYMFLLTIGWCLTLAEVASMVGLSAEIGAFIAGVSLASSPVTKFIALQLKPLRDFFLILFFFAIGASFNLGLLGQVIIPALILATVVTISKPAVYRYALKKTADNDSQAWEIGFRLGQTSEFSLLIAFLATSQGLIGIEASHVIQATAIITFLVSTYIVLLNYKSPLALKDELRRD